MLLAIALGIVLTAGPRVPAPPGTAFEDLHPAEFVSPAKRVVIYPFEGEVHMHSDRPMPPALQEMFDTDFSQSTYFSALAMSHDGGWGFSTTVNSRAAARKIAMLECLNVNTRCRLIAEILPVGFVPLAPGEITLTPEVAEHWMTFVDLPGIKAFAVSGDGAYAYLWNMPSQDEADQMALADCEAFRMTDLTRVPDLPCILLPQP
ncbi:MAG: hypothetical protein JJT81_16290 [Rubellimicrobium sp.]|nr:hypothetical protein [Rubellimicrobium sp.]